VAANPIVSIALHHDDDLIAARQRARQVASLLGYDAQDQARIATVAAEIARDVLRSGRGQLALGVESGDGLPMLVMTINGNVGDAPAGARRLMDDCEVRSTPGGTVVTMKKRLPPGSEVTRVRELAPQRTGNPRDEIEQQNEELLQALIALQASREELQRLDQELEDTNRGVLALYAELDEKADHLRRANQLKTRFLSDMSHEFRTPVNAIIALTRLLDEASLGAEERKQVSLIRRAAEDLSTLVNDLLDLAKIEAGKVEVHPAPVDVANLFSALRGILRPLLVNRSLALVFEEPEGISEMITDEAKLSQILRNFIANALKFTESGEIRVTATLGAGGRSVIFAVSDSGIGIAAEDQERIFEEFTQLDTPLQRQSKGTGLGLPLTRKLAGLLGGSVSVRSAPGAGSTFFAEIPLHAGEQRPLRVLVIDDDETARYTMTSFATRPGAVILEAENGLQGIATAQAERPDVILLDLMMPGVGGHEVLQRLRSDPATASIPVVITTSRFVNDEEREQILGKANAVISKAELSRETVMRAIEKALKQ
jgi:signal transduction histidine kinase/CheY-like chemotaxis protein